MNYVLYYVNWTCNYIKIDKQLTGKYGVRTVCLSHWRYNKNFI